MHKAILILPIAGILFGMALTSAEPRDGAADNTPDWFYPAWAAAAPNSAPLVVRDTGSALGRYSLKTKEMGLKDLARAHGHLCDGLVISYVQISEVLYQLFPDRIVDRTDLVAVSKNGPCWVDAVMLMTGARINFKTLRIDNSIGDRFIIQRISTGEAYRVHLKDGVFPPELAALETQIRKIRAEGKPVAASDIDKVERMQNDLMVRLLNANPSEVLCIEHLDGYIFNPTDLYGERGDVINKMMPRQ